MDIADTRWSRSIPGSVIDAMRPELIDAHFASARFKHRHAGLIDENVAIAMDDVELAVE